MVTPLDLNSGVVVKWIVPEEVKSLSINLVKIYRSFKENEGYQLLNSIQTQPSSIVDEYKDPEGKRDYYYLVTFCNSENNYESNYQITYFYPTPYEMKLIYRIKSSMPDVLRNNKFFSSLNDLDYLNGINLALSFFNMYPPQTNFRLENFPRRYDFLLFSLSLMFLIMSKYLPVSVKDWSYSEPGGVSMNITRGEKFSQAISIINENVGKFLPLIKMDLSSNLIVGVGTIPLPLSLGGIIPQGVMNVLDIFTAVGR